jgi:hypothetical protein
MQAMATTNQRAAAPNQSDTFCRILRDELGIEPDAKTTALVKQIKKNRY